MLHNVDEDNEFFMNNNVCLLVQLISTLDPANSNIPRGFVSTLNLNPIVLMQVVIDCRKLLSMAVHNGWREGE